MSVCVCMRKRERERERERDCMGREEEVDTHKMTKEKKR